MECVHINPKHTSNWILNSLLSIQCTVQKLIHLWPSLSHGWGNNSLRVKNNVYESGLHVKLNPHNGRAVTQTVNAVLSTPDIISCWESSPGMPVLCYTEICCSALCCIACHANPLRASAESEREHPVITCRMAAT